MRYIKPENVLSIAEALTRVGFPIHLLECDEWVRNHASEMFVEFSQHPQALLNVGGEPFAFCSGAEIFSFGGASKNEQGNWWGTNQGFAVVAEIREKVHTNPPGYATPTWTSQKIIFKLVRPA